MFQQPYDFRDESEALYQLLAPLDDGDFERKTQFKIDASVICVDGESALEVYE